MAHASRGTGKPTVATNREMTLPAYEERSERRVSSVAIPHTVGRRLSLLSLAALGVAYAIRHQSPLRFSSVL
jgi:hypothetical protein